MLAEYTGVLVILAAAALFAAGSLLLNRLLGPRQGYAGDDSRRRFDAKEEPFACGEAAERPVADESSPRGAAERPAASVSSPRGAAERPAASVSSPRGRQAVKFYLVAILFVVFLVEAVFFYLWAIVFSETGAAGLVAITVFSLPLVVGFVYEWAKGALEW